MGGLGDAVMLLMLLWVSGCLALTGASLVAALRGAPNALSLGLLIGGAVGLLLLLAVFVLGGVWL